MHITISSELIIQDPISDLVKWVQDNLIIKNPDFQKKKRMGLWAGNTPEYLLLYRVDGNSLIVPVGIGKHIKQFIPGADIKQDLANNPFINYQADIPLYEYQDPAVQVMKKAGCGILQSPCGSGKTQMGIALAASIDRKTLWITHTADLLNQSYDRAAMYMDKKLLGKITEGKVHIGTGITFATVQTLTKLDLQQYKYTWDVIIVDEVQRLAGTPTQVTMFSKVMNSLAARYKYGLSATVHRGDGLIKSTFAIVGDIAYTVPEEAVADKTMQVTVHKCNTGIKTSEVCLDTDGTMIYSELMNYLVFSQVRNYQIVEQLKVNKDHSNLILSDRLEHLEILMKMLDSPDAVMISGKMTSKSAKAERVKALEDMRTGKKKYLFASYSLAKEGLDIPCLDRLYLTTPKKDFAVVVQSIGRIARVFKDKIDAICYDYVDDIQFCENQYKKRKTHYRKKGCVIRE
ncbi:DEAD/DEAH box helicase family protein [Anaerocolumna sedimenticola]|uniref:DEAD/DEAH box helicase family protein n=1 Tax=Anaerocolumna sedimenticola TaxID=2696063 RepID=A0A6P1TNA6_9FIRM|nr:DEAD/DEAH box helicase family protein [Anaerocolumna sedimenticola]QHQ61371.1 DEAD/DEAH box helicase family protein [Anaerocolumna sedimenticola]